VLVSERAVFDVPGSKAVYLVTPENRIAVRKVATDGSYQGRSNVTSGLSGGETVVVDGVAKLHDGQAVTLRAAQAGRGETHP